jgi:uncharacterized protein YcaQ
MTEPLSGHIADYSRLSHDDLRTVLEAARREQARATAAHVSSLFGILGLLFAGNRKPYAGYVDA